MKIFNVGVINKVVDKNDQRLKPKENGLDNLNLALVTKNSRYTKPHRIKGETPFNSPGFSFVLFSRLCSK